MTTARILWTSLVLLAAATAVTDAQEVQPAAELRPGATQEQARALLGPPPRISRQILLLGSIEQWHYGVPHQVRLTFEQAKGQKPRLSSVRRLAPAPSGRP